jgi:periplasmic protein TonB
MFEQSLLLDPAAGKKTGALAASLTLQTLAVGVMIAIPLIYSDRLPEIPRFPTPTFLAPPPPLPPPVERAVASASPSRANPGPLKVYRIPRPDVTLSQLPSIDTIDAPPSYASSTDVGVLGSIGAASPMSQFFVEPMPKPKPRVAEPPSVPAKPVPIGGDVQSAKLVKKVIPVYPPLARQARVSGTVQLIGVIAKDGTIQQLQVVGGHPLLVKAALDAVRQWIYRPTLLNGQAVEVIAPIDVIFNLSN